MTPYIRTFSGHRFDVKPTPDQVYLEDIAVALSRLPRFMGHSTFPYSVAAHCLYVCALSPPRLKLQALFHDASEAYIGDMPSPFKALMPDYKKVEEDIMVAVAERFGFTLPIDPLVKSADQYALYKERMELFSLSSQKDAECIPAVPAPATIEWDFQFVSGLHPDHLAARFIARARFLVTHMYES